MSKPVFSPVHICLRGTICAAILFATNAAMAQTSFSDQKVRLVAAIEAAGCIVNELNQAGILVEVGLTPEQGGVIVKQMMDVGEAVPFGDDLRLNTAECQ
ncbi:MAG: hypothetical protein WD046_04385 [Paracoccaceae bacterium]